MPKATVSTTTTTKAATVAATEVKVLSIPAAVAKALGAYVSAEGAVQAAVKTSDSSLIKLAIAIREGYKSREEADPSVRPAIVAAYESQGRDKLHAGRQISRILNLAWPLSSIKEGYTPKQRQSALANLQAAITDEVKVLSLHDIAAGGAVYDPKKKEVIPAIKPGGKGSGGHNAKPPREAYTKAIEDAITAASQAQLDLEQILVPIIASILDCKVADDIAEIKEAIDNLPE